MSWRMKAAVCVLLVLCVVAFPPAFVLAQDAAGEAVVFSWGDFAAAILLAIKPALIELLNAGWLWLLAAIAASIPVGFRSYVLPLIDTLRAEQLLSRSAETAIGNTAGALAGKVATIPVANAVVREMIVRLIENGSPRIVDFIGLSVKGLADKAVARLVERGIVPADYSAAEAENAAYEALVLAGVDYEGIAFPTS